MAGPAGRVSELIGNTPLVRLDRLSPPGGGAVLVKLEYLNPGGSVKDRIALAMIQAAESAGSLPGRTVIEATSGNTGIGLAMVCAERGYHLRLTMPETMSYERRCLLERYGAEVILTPGRLGFAGAMDKAADLAARDPDLLHLRQFENPANPEVHRRTTAVEILEATGGRVAAFVAGMGTGGTLTGVGEVLKERVPGVRVIAVEPESCAVLSGGQPGPHAIEGIGPGFIPPLLNRSIIDDVMVVSDRQAFDVSAAVARQEGLLAGICGGALVHAARQVAATLPPAANVVTLLPDSGARYFSVEEYFRPYRETDLIW